MKPLNIALIGCGGRGQGHARNLKSSSRVNFLAVCDKIEEKAKRFAQKFDVESYTDSAELLKLKELEAVVVATQVKHHAPLSIQALEAGKNVLCEKPMADSLEAGHEMLKTVEKTGLKGVIGYQDYRFNPFYQTLKEVSSELEPVQVLLVHQRGIFMQKYLIFGSSYGIFDGATHSIDMVNWLMGKPKTVSGSLRVQTFTNTEAIDTVSIQIEYGDKNDQKIGNLIASMGGPGLQNLCQVVGKKGNAQRGNGGNVKVTDVSFSEEAGKEKDRQTTSSRIVELKALSSDNPTMSLQEAFADYIQGKSLKELGVATFSDGFNSLKVAEAAVLSHKRGEKVNLADIVPQ